MDREPSELVRKGLPCTDCGSHDALAEYDDGHTHCFSCKKSRFEDVSSQRVVFSKATPMGQAFVAASGAVQDAISSARPQAIPSRKLTLESCRKWDYLVRTTKGGHKQHLAVYRDPQGHPTGVKVRDTGTAQQASKAFAWVGESAGHLYGRNLWGRGGKKLVITEGEIDAITVSQAQSHQWPVVSIPGGVDSAVASITANLEWVNSFEQVLIGFDMDSQGREAAQKVAALLPPGKAFLIKWTEKDANAMWMAGDDAAKAITKCIWDAEAWRPDGIRDARDLTEECMRPPEWGIPWPWEPVTKWTYGIRTSSVITLGAGYGVGKTDIESEIAACIISGETRYGDTFEPEAVALFVYESGAATTKKAIAGKLFKKRFHIPQEADDPDPDWTQEDLFQAMAYMDQTLWGRGGQLYINDSKGAADWESVKSRMRFLKHAYGVRRFFVDPLSALVEEEADGDDAERKVIDRIMREAAKLAVELEATIFVFSHLTRPKDGPSHEEGGRVRGNQFRGSNAIGMFSDFVMGAERDTQSEEANLRALLRIRMVKDRFTGNSGGKTCDLMYDVQTGIYDVRLVEDFEG